MRYVNKQALLEWISDSLPHSINYNSIIIHNIMELSHDDFIEFTRIEEE